ncbi:uncharacterized protein LOC135106639 [Scylla paramamosain]|uniref:uncharacterized protein LOC135106639 n=1 Tax=Scylla paramamosain TaxID=85552 RepID=UPI0030827E1F
MGECLLSIIGEREYLLLPGLFQVYKLAQAKQIIEVRSQENGDGAHEGNNEENYQAERRQNHQRIDNDAEEGLRSILWDGAGCKGYVFLLREAHALLKVAMNGATEEWDYNGRYLVVGLDLKHVHKLIKSKKGIKTPHLAALVQVNGQGHWRLYTHLLFPRQVLAPVNSWQLIKRSNKLSVIYPDGFCDLQGATLNVRCGDRGWRTTRGPGWLECWAKEKLT